MKKSINLLEQEILKLNRIKVNLENEKSLNIDERFTSAYLSKIKRVDDYIIELKQAINTLNK